MTDTEAESTDDEPSQPKRCLECNIRGSARFTLGDEEDYVAVLYHYLDEHPNSHAFRGVIESTWIETLCCECDQPFFAPMKLGQAGLHCDAYCPDCAEEEWVRPLFVRKVSPEELVEFQANPTDDELTRSPKDAPVGQEEA